MIPETVIRGLLTGASAVTALVGTRIYPPGAVEAPTFPALVVELVSDVPDPPIFAAAGPNVSRARVQVTAYSRSYAELQSVIAAVKTACHLKYGTLSGAQVVSCVLDSRGPDGYAFDQRAHFHACDFHLTYLE